MTDRMAAATGPGASLQGQGNLPDTTGDHLAMGNVNESHSFDVAEALEADLGNLHPEDEALIESVVAAGETTQATQDSQQATAVAAPTEATTATAPAAAGAPKKKRKRGFSYARKKLLATKEVYLKPGCTYHGDQSLVGTITATAENLDARLRAAQQKLDLSTVESVQLPSRVDLMDDKGT
jgi:hypothetical protein